MTAEVVVIMTMSRRCNHWLRYAALLAKFSRRCLLIVVFCAASSHMSNEAFQRRLVHMARKRHLRIFHAQGTRVLRMVGRLLRFLMTIAARGDRKGRNRSWSFAAALRARFLLGRFTERGQQLEREVARQAIILVDWHSRLFT